MIGQCQIGVASSIWPYAVLRGDVQTIYIGHHSNIQDACVIHCGSAALSPPHGTPCHVGNYVTVGHKATLHACHIEDHCLIGIDSVIMDKSIIAKETIIGAKSLVPPGMTLKSGWLYVGTPVKAVRKLTSSELEHIHNSALFYAELVKTSYS